MIIQEIIEINNFKLKHTFSSEHKYIKQVETNIIYDETYDILERNFTYIETDNLIEEEFLP